MRFILLLFIAMPIIEMWLLIEVGGVIGALPTIGLVLLTAMIGMALLRIQGAQALMSAQQKMANQQVPARELADGVFFAIGGALLLTPGFVTDAVGFACLTPGVRTILIQFVLKQVFQSGRVNMQGFHRQQQAGGSGNTFEGEYRQESAADNNKNLDDKP